MVTLTGATSEHIYLQPIALASVAQRTASVVTADSWLTLWDSRSELSYAVYMYSTDVSYTI